ncbi:unnamed protein product [Rhodiola kirilowii]
MRSLKLTASTVVVDTASAPAEASPVPYLFGGFAAMLGGLIAFALLILACSYCKLYGEEHHGDDLERWKDEEEEKKKKEISVVYEERFVVILAGDDKPSCLATPENLKGGAEHLYEQQQSSAAKPPLFFHEQSRALHLHN